MNQQDGIRKSNIGSNDQQLDVLLKNGHRALQLLLQEASEAFAHSATVLSIFPRIAATVAVFCGAEAAFFSRDVGMNSPLMATRSNLKDFASEKVRRLNELLAECADLAAALPAVETRGDKAWLERFSRFKCSMTSHFDDDLQILFPAIDACSTPERAVMGRNFLLVMTATVNMSDLAQT